LVVVIAASLPLNLLPVFTVSEDLGLTDPLHMKMPHVSFPDDFDLFPSTVEFSADMG
jgi:hypothetical protein